jgi:dihydropteroate synthase
MRTKIMGVINATPDSFHSGSRFYGQDAVMQGLAFAQQGADIIDIGGESTRPGSEPVSIQEELQRVIPVVQKLAGKTDALLSIDTYKPEVAQAAMDAGASIVNDIHGMRSSSMRKVVADAKAACIIMHMQGTPKEMQASPAYKNAVEEVYAFLSDSCRLCESEGIAPSKITVDPGIGFGKTAEHNLQILRSIPRLKEIGKPVLVGASRKSFIGRILGSESKPLPVEQRLEGSLAVAAYSVMRGADVLRVHDVGETVRAVKIIEALQG